jgi:hypothetical protein
MKKYLFYGFVLAAMLTIASCHKDTGNYAYHPINQVSFTGFDTVKGYQVLYGGALSISPTTTGSLDQSGTGSYNYQWSWSIPVTTGGFKDSVISVTKNLSVTVKLVPGVYSLQYRVTDNGTGVTFHTRAKVNVTTDIFEGFMLLNDLGGQSRLDMLSYNLAANSFTQYVDVLKKMGSTVPMNGTPYQVYCATFTNTNIAVNNYGIYILNSAGCNRIDQETFAYDPTLMNIRSQFIGNLPSNFAPQRILMELSFNAYPLMHVFDGVGNVYNYGTLGGANGYNFHYIPLNSYTAAGTPFKIAPFGVSNGSTSLFYNTDKKNYVIEASYNSVITADAGANLNYPTGLNMIYMDKDYNNNAFAILKDPATSKIYLHKFTIGSATSYYQEIVGTDIASATSFALSPVFGYLFYSAGGKLYEYDPSLKTSVLMKDYGSATITYLNFQHFFNRTSSATNKANYGTWANYLNVASYGSSATSGTFELYNIPGLNGQITLVPGYSWSGFGKIVSVSYRER